MNRMARSIATLLAMFAFCTMPAVAQNPADTKAKLKALQPKDFPERPA